MKPKSLIICFLLFTSTISANTLPEECITHICSGGLGQDLFSFSAAYTHAKRLNIPLILDSDRDNGLLTIFHDKFRSVSKKRFKHFPIVVGIKNDKGNICYDYDHKDYNTANVTYYCNTCYGYFMGPGWVEENFEEIKAMIIPSKETLDIIHNKYANYLKAPIKVGIHLRTFKPDSIKSNYKWQQPSISYYEKAFSLLPDNAIFFVASDNMPFAKEMFSHFDKDFIFLNDNGSDDIAKFTGNNTTLEEFFLLTMCDHLLGTKSTFSWWAAILNTNPDKIVILPEIITNNRGLMIPESWTLLPYN